MDMARLQNNKNEEDSSERCQWYNVFGDCAGGCEKEHEGSVPKQTFFYAKIDYISTLTSTMTLSCPSDEKKKKKSFFVANQFWHLSKAVEGDCVLFQASKKKHHSGSKLGRVALKMSQTNPSPSILGAISPIRPQVEVFTLDPVGTSLYDDAYSIEECQVKGCKFIGIHISAVALQEGCQISTKCIPCYPYSKFKKTYFSLDKGKVVLAVSVYVHTECKGPKCQGPKCQGPKCQNPKCQESKTHGPVLTQVHVKDNYTYSDFKKYRHHLADLWTYFAEQSYFTERKKKYITRYPKTWRQRYVVEEMMMKFQSVVKKEQAGCFITQKWQHYYHKKNKKISEDETDNQHDTVVMSKKIYDDFVKERTKEEPKDSSILAFVASSLISIHNRAPIKSNLEWMDQYDVQTLSSSTEDNVPCTSPGRKFVHYVNQQIILNNLFKNSSPLYSSEDLSGIVGIRFRLPCLVKVLVKAVRGSTFEISYIDEQRRTPKVYEVPYKTFAEDSIVRRGKIEFRLKLFCEEKNFCNQDLVRLNSKALQSVYDEMRKREKLVGSGIIDKGSFVKLSQGKTEEKSPYQEHNDGTLLIIQPGAELHLQISHEDAQEKNEFGLRLLKIGIGCHFCITHIHHADLAFMSERKDIRELISPESITELRGATVEQKLANSITLRGIQIQWNSKYYTGGTFHTDESLTKGDLLCVRKDVGDEYVWCCHGVVSSEIGQKLTFEVCTLMQPESVPDGEKFYVEIVKRKIAPESPNQK